MAKSLEGITLSERMLTIWSAMFGFLASFTIFLLWLLGRGCVNNPCLRAHEIV